jgi:ketosteroid isomerase-like protein
MPVMTKVEQMSHVTTIEQEVMETLNHWSDVLHAKDLDALAECYTDDARVFDLGCQVEGSDQLRALWEKCLPYFPDSIVVQRKNLQLTVGPEVAVATFYCRLIGMVSVHPSCKSWMRATVCLQKVGDTWKIVHDHISFPIDCGAEKPNYIFD